MKLVLDNYHKFHDRRFFNAIKEGFEGDEKFEEGQEKMGLDIVKKCEENFSRFQTAAGGKIEKYKEFWDRHQQLKAEFSSKLGKPIAMFYPLYDSDFAVAMFEVEGAEKLAVLKYELEEDEENPYLVVSDETAATGFRDFHSDMMQHLVKTKKDYEETVLAKKKKEELEKKKKKLDSFMKE